MANETLSHYDQTTIRLHWATAILVVTLWIIGQTASWLPRGALRLDYWSIHVVLGFVLALLLIGRLVWRSSGGRRLPPSEKGLLHFIAEATHVLLYLLLVIVVGLGVINAFVRGYSLFGWVSLPQIGERTLGRPLTGLHGLSSNILLGLALLHALAALGHHYVLRDGVLRRMLATRG